MSGEQRNLDLLNEPVAQELLRSALPARLGYVALDGTPRVVPIWFHWNGKQIVLGTPPTAPKVQSLQKNPTVALSIDATTWPYRVLQIRGRANVDIVQGVAVEYSIAAEKYFGEAQGRQWVEQLRGMFTQMARIEIEPHWVGILDFETRFPSAIAAAM